MLRSLLRGLAPRRLGRIAAVAISVAWVATGCSDGSAVDDSAVTYTVGGRVSGLSSPGLTLMLNDGTPIEIAADGSFSFPESAKGAYQVVVATQPVGQICTVSNGSGDIGGTDVTDIRIVCAVRTFGVGGRVDGLGEGKRLVLLNNGVDPLTLRADGRFTFAAPVAYGGGYAITVGTQPAGQTCTVRHASADGVSAAVTQPVVVCSDLNYTVGGTVSGLTAGQHLTLKNNGADATVLAADGRFRFATPIAWHGSYEVTVATQPTAQTCTVSHGSGHGVIADTDDVAVTCSARTYTIGGSVSGLAADTQLTLRNNGADPVTLTANGEFAFPLPVAYDGSYAVTVSSQPVGQTCSIAQGSGTSVRGNVTGVQVICSSITYPLGGTASGLPTGSEVTLLNNGADPVAVTADGSFTFPTPVPHGGSYAVTVGTQPADAQCVVTNGAGASITGAVTDVVVSCTMFPVSFLYIPDYGDGKIIGLTLNRTNGDLNRSRNAPYAAGGMARWVALTPDRQHLYVANGTDNTIGVSSVDTATGALTALPAATITTGPSPIQVEVTPDGRFAYVLTDGDNAVRGYAVDGGTGSLTPVPGAPGSTGTAPAGFAIAPGGDRLYVANRYGPSVSAYAIDATTGALAEIAGSPYATSGGEVMSVAVHPNGHFLYAPNRYGVLDAYRIDATTGALTMLQSGGYAGSGSEWRSFGIDATGTHGYLGTGSGLFPYDIDATTGVPTLGGAALLPNFHSWIGFNADRTRLYAADFNAIAIGVYDVDAGTGALTAVGQGAYYGIDERPFNIAVIERTPSHCGGVWISSAPPVHRACKRQVVPRP